MNLLISSGTVTGVSETFNVDGQLTVFAFGLQPDQRVIFEIVEISETIKGVCGCPPGIVQLPEVTEGIPLQCCGTDVILTSESPWVIIDAPQGSKLIAILQENTGDDEAPVWVTVAPPTTQVVYWKETSVRDVTDCMRGCRCEVTDWSATGLTRCELETAYFEEISNCGTKRWTECGDVIWSPTGGTFCTDISIEGPGNCEIGSDGLTEGAGFYIEERNQCGTLRWAQICTPDEEGYYTLTGQVRCVYTPGGDNGYWEEQVANPCGRLLWRGGNFDNGGDNDLVWTATGNIRCGGETIEREERSEPCGLVRWVEDGGSVDWVATGNTRCVGNTFQQEERNQCGDFRWTDAGDVQWTATGNTTCANGIYAKEERSTCGGYRWVDALPLSWTPTGSYDCRSGTNWREERNQCGVSRWVDTGDTCGTSGHTMTTLVPRTANVIEGQQACWDFTLNSPVVGVPLTIDFNLSGADQVRNAYPTPQSVTLAVGATAGSLCITTTDDAVIDGDEQLCISPQLTARLTNGPGSSCILVLDNDSGAVDSTHTITLVGPSVATIVEGETICWFVQLDSNVSGNPLLINFTLSGTDQVRHGYTPPSLIIPIGQSSGSVCVVTTDDGAIDGTETLCLTAVLSPRITAAPAASCVDVLDNDAAPTNNLKPMGLGNYGGNTNGSHDVSMRYTLTIKADGTWEVLPQKTGNLSYTFTGAPLTGTWLTTVGPGEGAAFEIQVSPNVTVDQSGYVSTIGGITPPEITPAYGYVHLAADRSMTVYTGHMLDGNHTDGGSVFVSGWFDILLRRIGGVDPPQAEAFNTTFDANSLV